MFSAVKRKGGDRKEALLKMKMAATLNASLLAECECVFKRIDRKARTEESHRFWNHCLPSGQSPGSRTVRPPFLSGDRGGLCSRTACCSGRLRR